MKLITVAGPPSSGKTSVIIKAVRALMSDHPMRCGVIKFDCTSSLDCERYEANNIMARSGIAGNLCPDHYFVANVEECFQWGQREGLDCLITESAGLCNRCAPHLKGITAVCVLDSLGGINTPLKAGPMLKLADIVIVTKSDLVSQAEREVFRFKISQVNPRAGILTINGITGQGADSFATSMAQTQNFDSLEGARLRFAMPSALCSYCLGETRIGKEYQIGLNRKISL
ncbi:MAG TPA: GTP-binding protein [Chitinispirillaceae bacterium]|nr:GTP-binding protein [Chitinispirillaceae bacterium]